ncbi:hypothetical protein K458DRAFT_305886 [Lentithecium fluviatile CBS 122367]|uniref:F-box domain-containing protein n=1 Tax=Lentithecium fluviatile CBS 122367 TaxID=1168545 RepID=A0A6G1IYA3_9PLEO|nr:hypothetical protein K458DRAFT_305886 [Lentithecium fluviatile CBS 122367]
MDHAARRIPAWKRLGLKLKRNQSGEETQGDEHQVAEHQHSDRDIVWGDTLKDEQPAIRRAEESSLRLGKRKHLAEHDDQASKKSRKTQEEHDPHGDTAEVISNITHLDKGASELAASVAPTSDTPRPKGDPNYRRKKGRRSEQHDERKPVSEQTNESPEASGRNLGRRPRTPSLSPGQQDLASDGATLFVSTETDFPVMPATVASKKQVLSTKKSTTNSASSSLSPRVDRRKSVTFTPDTKTVDGNSASNLFKKWVQEQKGSVVEFSQAEIAQFAPPKSHPANDIPSPSATSNNASITPAVSIRGKKKDPSRYTAYLTQYYIDRSNWKFNKAKQNDVLENAPNIFRIPDTHEEALIAYIKGLQGAGVIERLKQRCTTAIKELDIETSTMDDPEVRKAAQEEALQEHLSRESKRRRVESDIENMLGHPYSEGYIRRLKRARAEALLTALNVAAPAPVHAKPQTNGSSKKFSPEPVRPLPSRRISRKSDASSDESSDSSSSEESASSSESSDDSDSDSSSNAGDTTGAAANDSDDGSGSGSDDSSQASSKIIPQSQLCTSNPLIKPDISLQPSHQARYQPPTLSSSLMSAMALSSLPTELIEQIAEHLDIQSLRSFRLTSSSISRQSLHLFKYRFFRKRTLKWNTESLRQLDDITSHPRFEGCLQDLVVDATPRFAIRMWELEKGVVDAAAQQDFEKRIHLQSSYLKIEEEAEDASRFWNETRQDQKTLAVVFTRLQTLLSVTFAYDGMDKNHLLFGRRYCENSQNEMSRPFVSTMAAIATSRLIVQSIGVDPERRYGAISIGRLESISPVLANFGDAFLKLDSLELNLRDWRYSDEGFEMPAGRAPFVVRFLSKFKNLRILELSCFSLLEDILPEMAKQCQFPHLEVCTLDLFRIRAVKVLFDFLEPSKNSLRSLRLSHIVLKDEHTEWDQVLRRIASEFTLEKAEFKSLFMRLGARVGFDGSMQGSLVLEAPGVKGQLEKHAANLVGGNWGPAWHLAAVAYPFIGLRT